MNGRMFFAIDLARIYGIMAIKLVVVVVIIVSDSVVPRRLLLLLFVLVAENLQLIVRLSLVCVCNDEAELSKSGFG